MTNAETVTITKAEYLELLEIKNTVSVLKYELAELKRMIYGAKSERFIPVDPKQGVLFDIPAEEPVESEKVEITYTRKKKEEKKQALRLELPAHLPRVEEIIEPENLPHDAKKIGETITEILEFEEATIYVRRIVRPKFIVSSNDEQTQIVVAELPSLPIPKGNAGPGLLTYILISKFVDHLPFYRLAQIFKRQDVIIAESTMGGWFNASCKLLELLYELLKQKILSGEYIQADETPIPVQTKDKPGSTHKGYHWVYHDPVNRLVLFDYQKTRSREGPDELLANYKGYLQTDGYTAYNNLRNGANIQQLACMAHARRKFEHALDNDKERAQRALTLIQQLYAIERKAKEDELGFDQIKQLRQIESEPILMELETWLKSEVHQVLPKSAIGNAISYTLTLWPRLKRYTENGSFRIDNNLIENSIRPVALGRKNYLFAGSHDAAQQAAVIYSLLATCKMNGIEPSAWLKNTLSKIADHPVNKLEQLLPIR
jgi:transposase